MTAGGESGGAGPVRTVAAPRRAMMACPGCPAATSSRRVARVGAMMAALENAALARIAELLLPLVGAMTTSRVSGT